MEASNTVSNMYKFYTISYVVLALMSLAILWSQYRIQKQQWKLALYKKRYPVFDATMMFISSMLKTDASDEVLVTFRRAARDKKFLFGNDACAYLDELFQKGTRMQLCVALINDGHNDTERAQAVDTKFQLIQWFVGQYDVATNIFEKYLRISDDTIFHKLRLMISHLDMRNHLGK